MGEDSREEIRDKKCVWRLRKVKGSCMGEMRRNK